MIQSFNIEATRKTPAIKLDPKGHIKIQGRSIPEDASIFYEGILDWVKNYILLGNESTRIDLNFEYLNSGTSKYVLQILKCLRDLPKHNHALTVNWYYEDGDDDILERGEYFASLLDLKINFIEN